MTLTITFPAPYAEPPAVFAAITAPDGEPDLTVTLVESTTTDATLLITPDPAVTGYTLHWASAPMPQPPLPTPDTMTLADTLAITAAAETVVITFDDEQATPPDSVTAIYLKPSAGGDNILAVPVLSSLSTTGFTVELSAPAEAGSSLAWSATFDLTIP